ncbi:MAG TPA: four helix bundle protein [Candidatus Binatia bacterium]
MTKSDLKIRTKDYALSVIRLFAALPKRTETQILGRQLLRSGTSVGARFYILRILEAWKSLKY